MAKERFLFGRNWNNFLKTLNEERIIEAEISLKTMLNIDSLAGKTFLDIGSGSGLFSLAAVRLGAKKVHSFDYDVDSVACTKELKSRFFSNFEGWKIEQASVLDQQYLQQLGVFDIVYSWGVLHHTGAMCTALKNTVSLVAEKGYLFIAIYNDQGLISTIWRQIKKIHNVMPVWARPLYIFLVWTPFELISVSRQIITGNLPWQHWIDYNKKRGMSIKYDIIDWIGGYPFEVASPEQIFRFYRDRGFQLKELKTKNGMGCNEFVFTK